MITEDYRLMLNQVQSYVEEYFEELHPNKEFYIEDIKLGYNEVYVEYLLNVNGEDVEYSTNIKLDKLL